MTIDEIIASYDTIGDDINEQDSNSFIPTEKECDDIFGINALRELTRKEKE